MKKIYLLEQDIISTDVYQFMIIIANDKEEAINLSYKYSDMLISEENVNWYKDYYTHFEIMTLENPYDNYKYVIKLWFSSWVLEKDIKIKEIGLANSDIVESKVICASYNAC